MGGAQAQTDGGFADRLLDCAGESEAKVRQLFEEAQRLAPCIIFIGEACALMPLSSACKLADMQTNLKCMNEAQSKMQGEQCILFEGRLPYTLSAAAHAPSEDSSLQQEDKHA